MNKQLPFKKQNSPSHYLKKLRPYRFALTLVMLSFLVMLFSPVVPELLRYQSSSVSEGQLWRILTANLCHSNWNHWLLNMLGLLIMDYFLKPVVTEWLRFIVLLTTMLGSVLMLHYFLNLQWYVGLSGALHGYLFAGALLSWRSSIKINALILLILSVKVVVENFWEINQSTENLIEANVVEEAHLFGVVSAIMFYLGYLLLKKISLTRNS